MTRNELRQVSGTGVGPAREAAREIARDRAGPRKLARMSRCDRVHMCGGFSPARRKQGLRDSDGNLTQLIPSHSELQSIPSPVSGFSPARRKPPARSHSPCSERVPIVFRACSDRVPSVFRLSSQEAPTARAFGG